MCGICGIANINGNPVDLALLKGMTDLMFHRGPDDEGIYAHKNIGIGVRRLNVIDLTTGHQPISNEDKSIWVVQNGEIYNYREIRKQMESKGHIYKTNSDTEAIVHLYEEYGEEFVSKLNGMFSIALWDEKEEKLILARDKIGIKPLFYFFDGHRLIFASEIKAIIRDSSVNREIEKAALAQYLTYRFVSAPLTMLKGVFKLLPGHILVYKEGKINTRPYWNFKYNDETINYSENYYSERLYEALKKSIQRHLISDVPLGVFLSGGIDSSVLVSMASELADKPIKTFSVIFENELCDEAKYARIVANRFKTKHHELMVKPDAIRILPKLIRNMDEPLGDSCALATYYLSKFAREYVTVALSGDGGDELFAGYDRYRREKIISFYGRIPRVLRERIFEPAGKFLLYKSKVDMVSKSSNLPLERRYKLWMEITSEEVKDEILKDSDFNPNGYSDIVLEYFNECGNVGNLNKMLYVDLKTYLPDDLLLKVDQMSMAHSLEVRVPFLDNEVVDFAANLPISLKLRGFSITKYLLRKYLKRYLPANIYRRRKHGFNLPVDSWFRGELKDYAYRILLDPGSRCSGILNTQRLELLLEEHQHGKDCGEAIWALVVFELWKKQFNV